VAHVFIDQTISLSEKRYDYFPATDIEYISITWLATFGAFETEKREITVKLPEESNIWQIARLIGALKYATDHLNNRSAFERVGLLINPAHLPAACSG
jgi:hypothetical protein